MISFAAFAALGVAGLHACSSGLGIECQNVLVKGAGSETAALSRLLFQCNAVTAENNP